MKSKVLLMYVPGIETGYGPIFPLGMGYLLSALKTERIVHSVNYEVMTGLFEDLHNIINSFEPKIIGITCTTFNRGNVSLVCKWIKDYFPDIKVIIGGVHASFFPEHMLFEYGADFVVIGEGEETICELCNAIDDGHLFPNRIKGIAFKKLGKEKDYIVTEPRERIKDLDLLNIPDFSYARKMMETSKLGFTITSRGCPAHCIFCSTSSFWGQKVRVNSPKRVVDEIEITQYTYGVEKSFFTMIHLI